MTDETNVSYRMGYRDAINGHGPSLLGGPYMEGYKKGRHEQGKTVGIRVVTPEDEVDELQAQIDELKSGKFDADEAQKNAWKRVRELEAELESERKRWSDEFNRLVLDWHDKVKELEAKICTYPDGLCKCPHFRGTP